MVGVISLDAHGGRGQMQTQVRVYTVINDLLKQEYAAVLGFQKGIGHNVCDALEKKYWE